MKVRSYLTLLLLLLGVTAWGQTTYKLEQVTSVEAGSMYVFEQDGYVMNNTISSSALRTTNNYSTTGLTGSESYVWTLESASGGFYLKNKKNEKYLTNTSSTDLSLSVNGVSVWAFSVPNDGEIFLIQNKSNSDRFLGYTSSTSHAYKAYATINLTSPSYPHAIKVYKLVKEFVPTFTVTFDQPETVFAETFNVTLTASPEDADIYYTLNGSTPTTGSTLYNPEEGITLNATATIKAVAAVNGVAGAVATATFQKNSPVIESLGDIFRRVSNVSTLRDGDQIIIVNEEHSKVLDKENGLSENNRKADNCVINGETIQMEDNNKILTLKKDGNGWILYTDDANFLYSESSNKNNYLKITSETNGLNSTRYVASISIENNNAKIAYCGGERWIMYNDVNDIFSCYKGTQKPVQIYRKESVDAITLNETSADNGTIISNAVKQGKVLSVNLYRQLTANMWNAICLPFDMDDAKMTALFGDGYKLRSFSGVEKDGANVTLMFDEATTLEAGVPYIVLPTKTVELNAVVVISDVTLTSTQPQVVTQTADGREYTFQGIYAPKSFTKDDKSIRFIGSGNKFYYPNSTNPMRAFRAYFKLPAGTTEAKVGMSFDEDMGVATGIVAVDGGAVDGRIYSMSGQYVGTSTQGLPRGLYIRDGRKFVVK